MTQRISATGALPPFSPGNWAQPLPEPSPSPPPQVLAPPKVPKIPDLGPAAILGTSTAWSNYDAYRSQDELYAAPGSRQKAIGRGRGRRDPRGLAAAGCSFVVLLLTLLPWFKWSVISHSGLTPLSRTIFDHGYRGWYLLIPLAAALGVVIGLVNALVRPGTSGAVALYVVMQLLALTTIGLVVAARFVALPPVVKQAHHVATVSASWPIYAALLVAVVTLLTTMASGLRTQKT